MRKFFYFFNLILLVAAAVFWIVNPIVGGMFHFGLGVLQVVNAIVYLFMSKQFSKHTLTMFRVYGIALAAMVILAIFSATSNVENGGLDKDMAIFLLILSGALAILFTYVTYLVKNEEEQIVKISDDEILDGDMIL